MTTSGSETNKKDKHTQRRRFFVLHENPPSCDCGSILAVERACDGLWIRLMIHELQAMKRRVESAPCDELFVRAHLFDAPVMQDEYSISFLDGL